MATWWWALQHRLHFFDVIDFVAPLVPPGLGFGRLGNFINAELWGKYTDAAWGVIFPGAEAPLARLPPAELQAQYASGALDRYARHPSPLYQALLEGVRSEEHTSELQPLMRISYARFCLQKKTN